MHGKLNIKKTINWCKHEKQREKRGCWSSAVSACEPPLTDRQSDQNAR